jgi:hypothetical protein
VWVTVREEALLIVTLVKVFEFCCMSMIVAPVTPIDWEEVEAEAPVKVTEPKLVRVTRAPFSSKSSTIHSAF